MKRRTKKLFSLLLSLVLVVGMIPAFGVTAYAVPTVSTITINADYTYLIVGSYTVPPNFDIYSNAGDIHFDRGNSYWKKYNESTGKYERYTKSIAEPGKYVYSYSLYIKKTEGIPASSVTVRINGKSQTVSFEGPDDYGNYYANVDDTEVITPRTLPALTGKVTLDYTENPIPANRTVKAVLSGGLEDLPSNTIYYQWEWKMENGNPGTFDGATSATLGLTEDFLGRTIRVRVFAEDYSGYVYSSWREVGDPAPYRITVFGGKADKTEAMPKQTVTVSAIPDNSDFSFDSWSVASDGAVSDRTSPSTTFVMPRGDVKITGNYKVKSTAGTNSWSGKTNPFVDVSKGTYYYDPVLWAYYASPQVTNGMDETHFGPMSTVTRGQCVTFLWRAKGCPEPTTKTNPFVDVPEKEYYYKPILWAVEKGITKGTDANHFSPNQKLSTAHIVTFLYRTLEKGTDGWYKEAGNWAYQDGLLVGTSLQDVHPDVDCPRGAVVTFLYRELANAASGVNELSKDDFLMYVEESYAITGRGRVVTGKVLNGIIRVGNKVTLISCDENTGAPARATYTVEGIEMFRRQMDSAEKGDNVGILLSADTGIKTPKGSALVNEGSSLKSSPGRFVGTFKRNSDYATKTLALGDTFQVYWAGYDVTAMLVDLNGGDITTDITREGVKLTLLYPEVFYIGQELTIREGGRTYGTFTVTGIE